MPKTGKSLFVDVRGRLVHYYREETKISDDDEDDGNHESWRQVDHRAAQTRWSVKAGLKADSARQRIRRFSVGLLRPGPCLLVYRR